LDIFSKRTVNHPLPRLLSLLLLLLPPMITLAKDSLSDSWGQLTIDNDLGSGNDNGYTGGFLYSWGTGGYSDFDAENLPAWIHYLTKDLYIATLADRQRAVAYGIAGKAFTPDDTDSKRVVVGDRPYAGLLSWRGDLYAFNSTLSDRLGLELGVVGPASGAEHIQDFAHDVTGSDKAEGWDNQLDNEPVFRLEAERLWRLRDGRLGGVEYDTIGMAQAGVGNLRSDVGAGLTLRIGENLADTWATASPGATRSAHALPGKQLRSWQVFVTAYGRYVANDITIDGNYFGDDNSTVSLEHGQATAALGFAVNHDSWGLLLAYQWGTDEFEEQDYNSDFATLSVAYRF
jgi:hypothetical protein